MSQRSYKASSPFVSTEFYYTSSALNLVIYYDENLNPDGNYNGYYISDEPIRTIFIPPSHWMGCTVGNIVVGYNKGWKDSIELGKKK